MRAKGQANSKIKEKEEKRTEIKTIGSHEGFSIDYHKGAQQLS